MWHRSIIATSKNTIWNCLLFMIISMITRIMDEITQIWNTRKCFLFLFLFSTNTKRRRDVEMIIHQYFLFALWSFIVFNSYFGDDLQWILLFNFVFLFGLAIAFPKGFLISRIIIVFVDVCLWNDWDAIAFTFTFNFISKHQK